MIQGINSDDNNLLQLLLQAGKKTSSSDKSNSSTSSDSVNSNGDDFLSCLQSNFNAADSNYDNELSKNEIDSFSKIAGTSKPMGPPPGMFLENEAQKITNTSDNSNDAISSIISSLDKDNDGTLSLDELTAKTSETNSNSQTDSSSLTNAFSNFLGSSTGSDLTSKLSNFIGQKAQEIYSNSSLLSNSSALSSAMSHIV